MNMHSYKNTARVAQVSQQVRKQMLRAPVLTRTDLGRIPLCTFHSTAGFCSPAGHGQLWSAAAKTYCCFRSVAYIYRHLLSQPEAAAHVSGRGHSRVTQTFVWKRQNGPQRCKYRRRQTTAATVQTQGQEGELYLCWQSLPRPPGSRSQSTRTRTSGASCPGFALEGKRKGKAELETNIYNFFYEAERFSSYWSGFCFSTLMSFSKRATWRHTVELNA